nr:MAG TPA: hypothetical protein [Bacteriophage sp.]
MEVYSIPEPLSLRVSMVKLILLLVILYFPFLMVSSI